MPLLEPMLAGRIRPAANAERPVARIELLRATARKILSLRSMDAARASSPFCGA
jgi:hypothetical protein